jgi:hypothetical protein
VKLLDDLCPTEELHRLFRLMGDQLPGIWSVPWSSAAIDEVNGKRILCLAITFPSGAPAFSHFCPDGVTEEEMQMITDRHGLDAFTPVEPKR